MLCAYLTRIERWKKGALLKSSMVTGKWRANMGVLTGKCFFKSGTAEKEKLQGKKHKERSFYLELVKGQTDRQAETETERDRFPLRTFLQVLMAANAHGL